MTPPIEKQKIKWLPLEANPDVWNKIIHDNGVASNWSFCDVFGFDPELLAFVPQPVEALIFLFPITDAYEAHRRETNAQIKAKQPTVFEDTKHIHFFKQTISNACGMIGLLHALANNKQKPGIFSADDALFPSIMRQTKDMTPNERAAFLETCAPLAQVHAHGAESGQTEAPSLEEQIYLHFICFVNIDGVLYQLDGRQEFPVSHGPITNSLLEDTVVVMKEFMARDPEEANFSAIALTSDQ
ncbi:hypothetical protein BC940DRAFT_312862 [Gongronella butleri]|nr:hypothetical protein BC940DRAFT_312862 [Gongronella butleri]